ncbi:MAG: HIT domain-containing protein [Bacteroidota bacterium]
MKRLFSPWRSAYIETFKANSKPGGCLFCSMARSRKDEKNLIVHRGKRCFVVMNLYPYNSGHLLIVPFRHTASLGRLTQEEYAEVLTLTSRSMDILDSLSGPHGFNFGANLGRMAGAGIERHVHFHVVPRWSGDTNFMPVLADTKMISEDMRKMWTVLSRKFGKNTKKRLK